jgi:methylmalonyl-CoA mutase
MLKHTGELPIIGVNTFREKDSGLEELISCVELSRATEQEKKSQLARLAEFKKLNSKKAPAALKRIFAELMNTVRVCSLGQITQALYDVGGQYRRNM